jgi:hypothetical protein
MSRIVNVPDEIYDEAARIAGERHVAVEDFIAAALVEQLATRDWVARRSARSSEREFLWALDQAPDVIPQDRD